MVRIKKIVNVVLISIILFSLLAVFTGCASTDKAECRSAISNVITSKYDPETDTTRFDFSLYFENGTIYNMTREDISFGLYKNSNYVKSVKYHWNNTVKADKTKTLNSYIVVDGEFDELKFEYWNSTYDNLWNTYKTWWIVVIVVSFFLPLVYLFVILLLDLELQYIVRSVGTWIGTVMIFAISLISPYLKGERNWFPMVICLIGCVVAILLCLLMSGVKAVLDFFGITPFESIREMIELKREEKYYQKLSKSVEECGENKSFLQQFNKDDLLFYCEKKRININGRKKSDLIDAIVADMNGEAMPIDKTDKKIKKDAAKADAKVITFNDIAGLERAKESFREKVILPFEHPELYKKFGKKTGGGILLYGLPGTGKTMFAEAAANEVDALFLPIKCSDIKSKWYGESEQKVKEVFVKARKSKKAIIFFDEFEAIGSKRTDNSDNANNDLVPEILAEMQGIESSKCESTIVVIAATNKPWMIDSAFLRPGRFDEKIYIPLPDEIARKKLFQLKLKDVPKTDLDFDEMARMTDGYNGADISEFCEKLKMKGINQSIKDGVEHFITMDDVAALSKEMRSSVSQEDIISFEEFERN